MIFVHVHQEHDERTMDGNGFDLFRCVRRHYEHAMTGAVLGQDLIVLVEHLATRGNVEFARNLDDPEQVRGAGSLPPFGVALAETRDEGRVGKVGLPLILAQPQETPASRTVYVQVHPEGELRTRSRRVCDKNGRNRDSGSGEVKTDSLGRGARTATMTRERCTALVFMPGVSPRFDANATNDGVFPTLTGNARPQHRVPRLIAAV